MGFYDVFQDNCWLYEMKKSGFENQFQNIPCEYWCVKKIAGLKYMNAFSVVWMCMLMCDLGITSVSGKALK